jgi:hypothetical protein
MTHPCKGNPGTTLHACSTERSANTLCGIPVVAVDVLAGYLSICPKCFPQGEGSDEGGDPIENR